MSCLHILVLSCVSFVAGYYLTVITFDLPSAKLHVAGSHIEVISKDIAYLGPGVLKNLLITSDGCRDVTCGGNDIFQDVKKLLLVVNGSSSLEYICFCLAVYTNNSQNIRIQMNNLSTSACVKPCDSSTINMVDAWPWSCAIKTARIVASSEAVVMDSFNPHMDCALCRVWC